jgi:hypothetical protein
MFALFGNLVVIAVVSKYKWMHTVTNFFIVNLVSHCEKTQFFPVYQSYTRSYFYSHTIVQLTFIFGISEGKCLRIHAIAFINNTIYLVHTELTFDIMCY